MKRVTLSFDNGPTPGVTDAVLDILSGAGVRNCGLGIDRPLCSVKRSAANMGASRPVTQTSPSPWQPCASPQEKSACSTCTGR